MISYETNTGNQGIDLSNFNDDCPLSLISKKNEQEIWKK